ncbi:hypothetical protein [uncultured Nitrospira sp.]|uniref:hypothetical protein n=1 Tax=uncultured Nitrospira sp. TaxID=157176 RepID=UPI0031400090
MVKIPMVHMTNEIPAIPDADNVTTRMTSSNISSIAVSRRGRSGADTLAERAETAYAWITSPLQTFSDQVTPEAIKLVKGR